MAAAKRPNGPVKKSATPEKKSSTLFIALLLLILGGGGLVVCIAGTIGGFLYYQDLPVPPTEDERLAEAPPNKDGKEPLKDNKEVEPPKDKKDDLPIKDKRDDSLIKDKKDGTLIKDKQVDPPFKDKKDDTPNKDKKKKPKDKEEDPPIAAPKDVPDALKFPGLLAYWSFDNIDGDKVKDLSDNGIEGKLVGNPKVIDGVRGKAIRLDGTPKQYFDFAGSPRLNFPADTPFTIAFWCRTERDVGTMLSMRHTKPKELNLIDLTLHQYQLKLEVRDQIGKGGKLALVMNGKLVKNRWHHLAVTRNGKTLELFLDGKSVGKSFSASAGGLIESDLRTLGLEQFWLKEFPFGSPTFQGAFDEFCIFNRVLNEEELKALAGQAEMAP